MRATPVWLTIYRETAIPGDQELAKCRYFFLRRLVFCLFAAVLRMATTPMTPLTRKATIQTLQRLPSVRRSSFLLELRDQLQSQYEGEVERERLKEVLAIHRILEKAPETRDSQDIDTLYEFVLQNGSTNKIFHGAQEIICKTICREMTLLELPAKGIVCYQGDYGDTFFIIIEGSVSLFIDSKKKLLVQNEENGILDKPHDSHHRHMTERMDGEGNPLPVNHGSFIKQIGSGGTFGELAVMDPTARRSCTILCDAPTSFICLKRGAYQRLIRITNSSQLDFTQVEYLETLFFFEQWPHGELTRLSNRLRHLNFPADTFLTRVGSEANVVFFIYSGIVQESTPLVHYLNPNGTVFKCTRLENESSKRSIQESGSNANMNGNANGKDAKKKQQQQQTKRIALELNVYQDHDVCGEYPVLFNKTVCNTDLLAVTDVKTLIMDVSIVLPSLYRSHAHVANPCITVSALTVIERDVEGALLHARAGAHSRLVPEAPLARGGARELAPDAHEARAREPGARAHHVRFAKLVLSRMA